MEYLSSLVFPLGIAAQFLRGNGVPLKWVSGIMFVVCIGLVVLARTPDEPLMKTVSDGALWIAGAFGTMFGTAAGAYKYASAGSNPEERAARADLPLVPVTDPNKVISPKP